MLSLLDRVALRAHQQPNFIALSDGEKDVTTADLLSAVLQVREKVEAMQCRSIAISGDNTLGWIICDLALMGLPVRVVPIPTFFSAAQIEHVVAEANIDTVLGSREALQTLALPTTTLNSVLLPAFDILAATVVKHKQHGVPINAYEKVTFTSGSTSNAKGVRLSLRTLERTAQAIASALAPQRIESHLGVLPYATLLENVAGIYAPLLQGVTIHVRKMAQLGLTSPEQFNPFLLLGEIQKVKPQATILVPQLLLALVSLGERGLSPGDSFRFIAVGGGKVASSLLEKARALKLPVFEGYGLSECGSVVTLNLPGNTRDGTTGKPLSHCQIRIAQDGEIMIKGAVMSGYLNEPEHVPAEEIATGDLGYFDDNGFLHVSGRKKNMFITAFGRNVNPEWVEAELLRHLPIRQVAVFGEAMPHNIAIVVVRNGFTTADVDAAIAQCNQTLPDYARIGRIILSPTPFTADNGMATANGRVRRAAVASHFASEIQNDLFSLEKNHAVL